MPVLQTIASGLLSRTAARRIGRLIPHPLVRFVVVTAATSLVPVLIDQASARWQARRRRSAKRRAVRG